MKKYTGIWMLVCGFILIAHLLSGCQSEKKDKDSQQLNAAPVIDITAIDYAFQAPDSIPSGWTTFRMENKGEEHHLMLLYRLPEGRLFSEYLELAEPFEQVLEALEKEVLKAEEAVVTLKNLLPPWSAEILPMGGPGLIAPGRIAKTSVYLDPGNYVMECYTKTRDGRLHASLGMVRPIKVTSKKSSSSAPKADIALHLNEGEFITSSELVAGIKTIAVHFEGSPQDVHLAKITDSTDLVKLRNWMNLLNKDGFREPAPAYFLGGAGGMPVGHTAYFTVDLDSGQYVWISDPTTVEKFNVK